MDRLTLDELMRRADRPVRTITFTNARDHAKAERMKAQQLMNSLLQHDAHVWRWRIWLLPFSRATRLGLMRDYTGLSHDGL